ncbi:MAG: NYN domain-containing protein [Candidatus Saccharimonas sp.]|nr:NYN domain-containing protein [Planctomycetaceae bacterium]
MAAIPFLIIDGYNLLHAAGLARANYAQGDLQRQRHQLLVRLTGSLSTEERQRCTVVFDAIDAPVGLDREYQHEGIAVLFAEPGHEADELIEQLVARHSAARNLIVVSSDHRLQRAARGRRAASLDSEAFLARLSRRGEAIQTTSRSGEVSDGAAKPSQASDPDVAYWLREFGPIDVETIASEEETSATNSADPWQRGIDELQRELDNPESLDRWLDERPRSRRGPRPE